MIRRTFLTAALVASLSAGFAVAAGDPYPLATDALTGAPLGDKPVTYVHEGRELKFADASSVEKFKANPAAALEKLDEQLVAQQKPNFPTDKCLISDEPLGDMGVPLEVIYNNRLVRLCCAGCVKSVPKKAETVFKKLDAEVVKKQVDNYPLKTDVVTGEGLGSQPIDYVIGTTLVRFAKAENIETFKADPAKYLAKIK